jgi:hypothetical protein
VSTGCENFTKGQKLSISVACLLTFVQENFTGPNIFHDSSIIQLKTINQMWDPSNFIVDGIEINENIKNAELLFIAKNLIEEILDKNSSELVSNVFLSKILFVLKQYMF